MDIPELVQQRLGGEQLRTGVMLGDDDVLCITATRTLLYRADGLLSDERVEEYPHNIERLEISESRRKTKFVLEYVEGSESLSVPNDLAREVLGLLLEGALLAEGIVDDDESVAGAFRFSELTLVVCGKRVVKHVGNTVWEDDHESFVFEDLTGLEFEEASVATEIVLETDGRPQRIKTPNDKTRIVEQTVKKAVFEFFGVASMGELDAHFEAEAAERQANDEGESTSGNDDIGLEGGGGIDPLVDDSGSDSPLSDSLPEAEEEQTGSSQSERGAERATERQSRRTDTPSRRESGDTERARESRSRRTREERADSEAPWPSERAESKPAEGTSLTEEDLDQVTQQLSDLTEAVNRQNKLLRSQQQAIEQLIEELRQGR